VPFVVDDRRADPSEPAAHQLSVRDARDGMWRMDSNVMYIDI
jgi:hypothetical protein